MNCVTIYKAKYIDIVTLKLLPTTSFRYNSEKMSSKISIPKEKQSRIAMSFAIQLL